MLYKSKRPHPHWGDDIIEANQWFPELGNVFDVVREEGTDYGILRAAGSWTRVIRPGDYVGQRPGRVKWGCSKEVFEETWEQLNDGPRDRIDESSQQGQG
jgi:hypothetical protein